MSVKKVNLHPPRRGGLGYFPSSKKINRFEHHLMLEISKQSWWPRRRRRLSFITSILSLPLSLSLSLYFYFSQWRRVQRVLLLLHSSDDTGCPASLDLAVFDLFTFYSHPLDSEIYFYPSRGLVHQFVEIPIGWLNPTLWLALLDLLQWSCLIISWFNCLRLKFNLSSRCLLNPEECKNIIQRADNYKTAYKSLNSRPSVFIFISLPPSWPD